MYNYSKRTGLLIAYLTIFLSVLIYNNSLIFGQDIPTETYDREVFISVDYEFNNEFLYKPYQIRVIPATKEIVVLDIGNVCFFVFTDEVKFIRKIGRKGQGPGDLLNPIYFDVDNEGSIYVYEAGNRRVSIFDINGKFVNSFRVGNNPRGTLFVTEKREIVMNLPSRGYLITVFSGNGEILQEIGELPQMHVDQTFISMMLMGIPFKDENGNFYIFLEELHVIKIFDESGSLIREEKLDIIFPHIPSKENLESRTGASRVYSGNFRPAPGLNVTFFWDIIYRNNKFYALSIIRETGSEINTKNFTVFVLNKDLEIEKKLIVAFEKPIGMGHNMVTMATEREGVVFGSFASGFSFRFKFDVLPDMENMLFPIGERSEIYLFTQRKKNRVFP